MASTLGAPHGGAVTAEAPRSGAVTLEEREINLAAPAHDLAPRIISREPADFPVPTARDEEWRFTPLRRLRGLHDGSALGAGADALDVTWSTLGAATVEVVDHADERVGAWYTPTDRVAAETFAAAKRAAVVTVAREAEQAGAWLNLVGIAERAQVGHIVVEIGANAHATVALDHVGAAEAAVGTIVEVHVGQGAHLTLVSYHGWEDTAAHVGHLHAVLDADAALRSVVVTLGGDVVRHSASVEYTGRHADAQLIGVYFADAGQHQEHRLFVDHTVPDCHSDVIYKGALQGDNAHSVWIGDVLIRAAATGTKTFELNRNLVLTEGARADSVPNLEIETGQIEGAGHASATGRFDDEQLFYLMSRGVPEAVARRLVVRGFFADAIARIGDAATEERLLTAVDAELGAIDPLFDFASVDAEQVTL